MVMDKHNTVDNEAILPRAKMGDEAALKVIYDRHFSPVFRIAFRYTGSVEDAEEITQETFAKAFCHLGRVWSRDTESLGPWIRRICVRNSISFLRRGKRLGRPRRMSGEGTNPAATLFPVKNRLGGFRSGRCFPGRHRDRGGGFPS